MTCEPSRPEHFCYNFYETLLLIILCLLYYYLGEPQRDVQVRVQALQLLGDEGR